MRRIVALVFQGITCTTRETVIDLGPLQATKEEKKTVPLPPALGGLALVGGIALVIVGSRRARDDASGCRRRATPAHAMT